MRPLRSTVSLLAPHDAIGDAQCAHGHALGTGSDTDDTNADGKRSSFDRGLTSCVKDLENPGHLQNAAIMILGVEADAADLLVRRAVEPDSLTADRLHAALPCLIVDTEPAGSIRGLSDCRNQRSCGG